MNGLMSTRGNEERESVGERVDQFHDLLKQVPKHLHEEAIRELFLRSLPLLSDYLWNLVREEALKSPRIN